MQSLICGTINVLKMESKIFIVTRFAKGSNLFASFLQNWLLPFASLGIINIDVVFFFLSILVSYSSHIISGLISNLLDFQVDFAPDLCSRVTFVNFTVTRSSLQDQCLNQVSIFF